MDRKQTLAAADYLLKAGDGAVIHVFYQVK